MESRFLYWYIREDEIMAVKIGNSWVSEAAYSYAQARIAKGNTEEKSS